MRVQDYVAGFLFDETKEKVALIRKISPAWQKGYLNGIGGKVEIGEKVPDAMVREFEEETGSRIETWKQFCILSGDDYTVSFFWAIGDLDALESVEEEEVEIHDVDSLFDLKIIPNLLWLIPMALDPNASFATVLDGVETT